ncbi:MAG: thiazole biosynthesis protein [Desulfobacteraceae bacterium]|nr:MAG: thiazole biosynthesis protein [Desulfobacteraceae bacterium]
MALNEIIITKAIFDRFYAKLKDSLESDVAIVGGGPSGLVAGYYLAQAGKSVVLYERKLSIGGGMMFNEIVVQAATLHILEEFGGVFNNYQENYYTSDSVETVSSPIARAVQAGLTIFNCMSVEDVMMRTERITGLVLNWSPVEMAGLHIDPLAVRSDFVIDATGHAAEVVRVVHRKVPGELNTPTGKIEGEKSMWSEKAETLTLENTREAFPGLYVAGMAANATFGGPRMGKIFGGTLLSGEKVARELLKKL